MTEPFDQHPDIQAAADIAKELKLRAIQRAFAGTGLSSGTIQELAALNVCSPDALTDGSWTEASMQRDLSAAAFREVNEYRRRT